MLKKRILLSLIYTFLVLAICIIPIQMNKEYTVNEALEIAFKEATIHNENAKLYYMSSLDERSNTSSELGKNGHRRAWNFDFGIENSNNHIVFTLHKGEIKNLTFTLGPDIPNELMSLEDVKIDSPEAVKIARQDFNLKPGENWAYGYHYNVMRLDDIPMMLVVGLNSNKKMHQIKFNTLTGNVIK